MEVRTFLNHRIVPPPRVSPRLFSPVQPGGDDLHQEGRGLEVRVLPGRLPPGGDGA